MTNRIDTAAERARLIADLHEYKVQQIVAGGSWWETPEICLDAATAITDLADALEDSRMTEAALRDALKDVERERDAAASLRPLWMDEAEAHQARSRAVKALDHIWRSRTMAPCCPHCRKGLLLEDVLHGLATVGVEYERARRAREAKP